MIDAGTWDTHECDALIDELAALRIAMLAREKEAAVGLAALDPAYQPSARNLVHYLELRRRDLRELQDRLARLGLSSLGRAESHVLANLDKVLGILHRLAGREWTSGTDDEPTGIRSGARLLEQRTEDLLGAAPKGRRVRIMVTLPSEAARDYGLVKKLVVGGMDVARINCAHDGADAWRTMAAHVRRAARSLGRGVRVLMDLGGPKLRTGALPAGTAVLKLRPVRDELGRVQAPARLGLRADESTPPVDGADVQATADADWLAGLRARDAVRFVDARGAHRVLKVERRDAQGVLLRTDDTCYLVPKTRLERPPRGDGPLVTRLGRIPHRPAELLLQRGDVLRLVHPDDGVEDAGARAHERPHKRPRRIVCTLPAVFTQVHQGERVWFDDGRIGGQVRAASARWMDVEITDTRAGGDRLAEDKGINLPDSELSLPALTGQDLADLATAAEVADLVGLSFVQAAADVRQLRSELTRLGRPDLGVVLKIETRRAFDQLPALLLEAMHGSAVGVMIARGDLAVECGYERLAEVQEEILWACEAAHMPVIWATQVLESLAKTGRPSRSEITDAAMSERAECVMLNKGPFIVDAMRMLDDILQRMQAHVSKKRPLLRALRAWQTPQV